MAPAQIAFAGTPDFAVASLQALRAAGYALTGVLTQPDRPAGRGRKPTPSPVKRAAGELPVHQPEKLRDVALLQALGPVPDLLVVVAYGLILPPWLLEWPRCGAVNVHASLLPRWRGAAPIQRALLAGDAQTGVSIMQMDRGLDTGAVHATAVVDIGATTTAAQLHDDLAALGACTLIEVLPRILDGTSVAQPQDDSGATYAHRIDKAEAKIDWHDSALNIERRVRAFSGWPVAESTLADGQRLRIWRAMSTAEAHTAAPGAVLGADADGITVAAGQGCVRILELQPPGGRVMAASAWLTAHPLNNARFISATR